MTKVLWPAAVLAVFVFTALARADEKNDAKNQNNEKVKKAHKKDTKQDEGNNRAMPRKGGKEGGKQGQDNEERAEPDLPRMQYWHTTTARRSGIYTLEGEKGTAEYYFNGRRHRDRLAFVRAATVGGSRGFVYQVRRNGRKVGLWFFFSARPSRDPARGEVYRMYYSLQPDDSRGRKMWTRILTPTGTKGTTGQMIKRPTPASRR
jgi:hypothetical protein